MHFNNVLGQFDLRNQQPEAACMILNDSMTGLRYLLDSFQQLHLSGSAPYSTGTQD
jgi:hypothetical protein